MLTKTKLKKIAITSLVLVVLFVMSSIALATEAEGRQAYYAQFNDTIEKIAFIYNLDEKLLAAMNNLDLSDPLREGQRIWLPLEPSTETVVTTKELQVQEGDTLWDLARSNHTSVAELCVLNDIDHPDYLRVGQVLQLPAEDDGLSSQTTRMVLASSGLSSRSSQFTWPTEGVISSYFGWRTRGWHSGLDIAADSGSIVTASASGIVTEAGWKNNSYGYTVMLSHGENVETLYAHNSELLVQIGDFVRQGDAIALVGSTGNSTGPHVHLEVRINGECQNPLEYLR